MGEWDHLSAVKEKTDLRLMHSKSRVPAAMHCGIYSGFRPYCNRSGLSAGSDNRGLARNRCYENRFIRQLHTNRSLRLIVNLVVNIRARSLRKTQHTQSSKAVRVVVRVLTSLETDEPEFYRLLNIFRRR